MNLFECKCNKCEARFITDIENDNEKCECPACNCEDVTKTAIDSPESGCGGGCSDCGSCQQ